MRSGLCRIMPGVSRELSPPCGETGLRARTVAAVRRHLPELDDEAAWRGALAGAARCSRCCVAIAVLVPLRDRLDTGSLALVLLLPPLIATNGGRTLSLVLALISALTFNFLFTHAVLLVPHRVVREHRRLPHLHPDRGRARQLRRRLPLGQRSREAARAQHGAAAGAGDRSDPLRRPAGRRCAERSRISAKDLEACAEPRCA